MEDSWWDSLYIIMFSVSLSAKTACVLIIFFPYLEIPGSHSVFTTQKQVVRSITIFDDFFQQRMEKSTGVLEQQWRVAGGTWNTRQLPWFKWDTGERIMPLAHITELKWLKKWLKNHNSAKEGLDVLHIPSVSHQQHCRHLVLM